jgi:hypothetical protein
MAIEARIRELRHRHEDLEKAIEDEVKHPAFDDLKLKQMKSRKLRLKDEMQALQERLN